MSKSQLRKPRTQNITHLFRGASTADIEAGALWYTDAHQLAVVLAERHHRTVNQVAGIMAALSPNNGWGANVNLTVRFMEANGDMYDGYFKNQLSKARTIYGLAFGHTTDILDILNGDKTQNFFLSIASKGKLGVCIDRHAYSLAVGFRYSDGIIPKLQGERYEEVASKYIRAAEILSAEYGQEFTPAQVQSVTWTLWRRKFWSANAFNGHVEVV